MVACKKIFNSQWDCRTSENKSAKSNHGFNRIRLEQMHWSSLVSLLEAKGPLEKRQDSVGTKTIPHIGSIGRQHPAEATGILLPTFPWKSYNMDNPGPSVFDDKITWAFFICILVFPPGFYCILCFRTQYLSVFGVIYLPVDDSHRQ